MNEKEAREIVSRVDNNEEAVGRFNNLADLGSKYWVAKGYLEYFEQTKSLKEALSLAKRELNLLGYGKGALGIVIDEALSQWEKIQNEK